MLANNATSKDYFKKSLIITHNLILRAKEFHTLLIEILFSTGLAKTYALTHVMQDHSVHVQLEVHKATLICLTLLSECPSQIVRYFYSTHSICAYFFPFSPTNGTNFPKFLSQCSLLSHIMGRRALLRNPKKKCRIRTSSSQPFDINHQQIEV